MTCYVTAWMLKIKASHGSLENFDHAPTIRAHRRAVLDMIEDHERIAGTITDHNAQAEYVSIFTPEVERGRRQVHEMDAWLAGRGLEP